MEHVIVERESGKFFGWPANNGVWSWADEIVVGYSMGGYQEKTDDHSISRDEPHASLLARSVDGGKIWTREQPSNYDSREAIPLSGEVDFAHPDLTVRCRGDLFQVSYDRCRTWLGPYRLPDFGFTEKLTSRTDYMVNGPRDCFFFLSVHAPDVQAGIADRAFCVRTTDGGRTFSRPSWMLYEPAQVRSVMPSTVRVSDTELVSALRRRLDVEVAGGKQKNCWIDVSCSQDNGKTWQFLSKVADTDSPQHQRNGNPPSLVRLKDGGLCVTYGYRSTPCGMRAKISRDVGRTWGKEIILRDDARTWDFGYPRSVVRADGSVVTIYYYTTEANPQQHIAATIWSPGEVRA